MPRTKAPLYWNKKDGTQILIKDMSNEYLLQTINNLEAQARKADKGKIDPTKLDPIYYTLKMHAVQRDLVK